MGIDASEEGMVQHLLNYVFRREDASARFAKQRHQSVQLTGVGELVLGREVLFYAFLILLTVTGDRKIGCFSGSWNSGGGSFTRTSRCPSDSSRKQLQVKLYLPQRTNSNLLTKQVLCS